MASELWALFITGLCAKWNTEAMSKSYTGFQPKFPRSFNKSMLIALHTLVTVSKRT